MCNSSDLEGPYVLLAEVSEPFGPLSLHWRLPHNIRFPVVGDIGQHLRLSPSLLYNIVL